VREVEKVLREELKRDRAKIDTSHISKFGLMELSRQRLRPSLESRSYQVCQHCNGRGMVLSVESASLAYLRRIWLGASKGDVSKINGSLPVDVASYLLNRKRKELTDIENRYGVTILIHGDPLLAPGGGKLDLRREKKVRELEQSSDIPPAVRRTGDGSAESKFLHETLMYVFCRYQ